MTTTYGRGNGTSPGRRHRGHPAGFFAEPLEGRRLLSAGDPDPSFDGDGRATATFPDGVIGFARAVAVQGDGKTVVVGGSTNNRFSVVRYNVDGSLDTTFGPNFTGMVLTSLGHGNEANAVAVQGDGKIVVAG